MGTMPALADLNKQVADTFRELWAEEVTLGVPEPTDLLLNTNHAKQIESATVLYADLDGSTAMVDQQAWFVAAEVYKTYLRCAAQIIRAEDGVITAYDGDRIMAIFVGEMKNTRAVRAALRINFAVTRIIQPAFVSQYPRNHLRIAAVCGIDTSPLRAARIGVKGDNDIVWVGRAANYAAKLTNLSEQPTWITQAVYSVMADEVKYHVSNGVKLDMWTLKYWSPMNNMPIYCSNYLWSIL